MQIHHLSIHDGDSIIEDIAISQCVNTQSILPENVLLEFVTLVDVSAVPLYLVAGPSMTVETPTQSTVEWFENAFSQSDGPNDYSTSEMSTHNVAILTRVTKTETQFPPCSTSIPITEMVFFVHQSSERLSTPPTPPASSPTLEDVTSQRTLGIMALPLSSTLNKLLPPSPPPSPISQEPTFLPSLDMRFQQEEESRKRKRVADVLDEASETQRNARRRRFQVSPEKSGSQSGKSNVINVLVPKRKPALSETNALPLSDIIGQDVNTSLRTTGSDLQPQLSVSKTRRVPVVATKLRRASALSSVTSFAVSDDGSDDLEIRNKELISRAVMTGMRLYGLQQRKKPITSARSESQTQPQIQHSRKSSTSSLQVQRLNSSTPEPKLNDGAQQARADEDEEYKIIYHQTYRGAICAFRRQMAKEALSTRPGIVQDIVDRLLGILCADPMEDQGSGGHHGSNGLVDSVQL